MVNTFAIDDENHLEQIQLGDYSYNANELLADLKTLGLGVEAELDVVNEAQNEFNSLGMKTHSIDCSTTVR